ncbi:MAG: DUF1501 domain-containing protein [Isosphaeraceae bacterium]
MQPHQSTPPSRREWLKQSGAGLGGLALGILAAEEEARSQTTAISSTPGILKGVLHHPPKATRVVELFMAGAASHVDLFDYKPELVRRDGQESNFGEKVETFQNGLGPWLRPVWKFGQYGQSGRYLSEVVADFAPVADEMAFVHNMVGKTGVHSQATLLQTTGFNLPGFPSAGAWVSYALGSMNDNLPTFVVMPDHRGLASNGTKNWDAAFLPGQYAGTVAYPGQPTPIANLRPDARYVSRFSSESEIESYELMARLNRAHASERPGDPRLEARIRGYELAARMQLAAPQAFDLSQEPKHILRLYGLEDIPNTYPAEINAREEIHIFARKCLTARRLLEQGVRFVQIWSGNDNGFPRRNWDSHEDIQRDHGPLARGMARGASAFIQDLRQRGMLDDTIVIWSTEFGRMPSSQGGRGRDHNPYCFTTWLAGGGVKGGISHGPSDDFGYKPADRDNPTMIYDIHATVLHLLGIDHKKLTVRHNGIDRRLTDVHGHVIKELIS